MLSGIRGRLRFQRVKVAPIGLKLGYRQRKGIAPDQLEAIFTPYFTTKADGTGLGLAVVQNIIEQHGGTIQVTSVEGRGTVFTLWLPINAKPQD